MAVTVLACAIGGELLARHLVSHDAALAGDLARLALTRSLPASAFDPSVPTDRSDYARAVNEIVASNDVVRVILYDRTGRVLWSDDSRLIGRRYETNSELTNALTGRLQAHIVRPGKAEHEALPYARVEEIYIPVRYDKHGPVVGALEVYRSPAGFFTALDRGLALIWMLGGGGGLVLYAALFSVVRFGVVEVSPPAAHAERSEAALRRMNDTLEAEARRLAHEVHDQAGQLVAVAQLALTGLTRGIGPVARESLQEVGVVLDEIAGQLRRLSHELRPVILDDLGLGPALESFARGISSRTALTIRVDAGDIGRLPSMVETALYRVVHEAITNVLKHARAKTVVIRAERQPNGIACTVHDDGVGFDAAAIARRPDPGLGLIGIRNRVEALGGTVDVVSGAGQGTRLLIGIPLV